MSYNHSKYFFKRFLLILLLSNFLFFQSNLIFAVTLPNPLGTRTICVIIKDTIGFFIGAGGLIAGVIVVWAAFQFLFSNGEPAKIQNARKTILYTIIGYAILISAWGIIRIVQQLLGATATGAGC